jgi:hypothetical protein
MTRAIETPTKPVGFLPEFTEVIRLRGPLCLRDVGQREGGAASEGVLHLNGLALIRRNPRELNAAVPSLTPEKGSPIPE